MFPQTPPALVRQLAPTEAELSAALDSSARSHRIPTVLLRGLAWKESREPASRPDRAGLLGVPTKGRTDVERLRADWRYNVEQGARQLELMWNRAPILGNGRLDDGRNILECWFFALGRYGAGVNGTPEANLYANQILDAVREKTGLSVTRPSAEKLSWGRNAFGPPAPWHFGDVAPRPPVQLVANLAVPYVQQVWDSPDGFDGSGACGPCALTMALAYLKKVPTKPVAVSESYPHESPLGGNVPTVYAAVCEPGMGAIHQKMLDFVRPLVPGVAIFYNEKATFARVKAELDAGRPVVLGTKVTPAGHIMTARGYSADGRIFVNDPGGNRDLAARWNRPDGEWSKTGGRYWNGEGRGALYDWDALEVRWIMTFGPKSEGGDRPEDGGG